MDKKCLRAASAASANERRGRRTKLYNKIILANFAKKNNRYGAGARIGSVFFYSTNKGKPPNAMFGGF